MPTYRCQVVFPMFTNFPSDVITNTLHFDPLTPLDMAATAAIVNPLLRTFYNSIYDTTYPMANYMVPLIAEFRWYDLAAPPPRAPLVFDAGLTLSTAVSNVPTEVAMVLSFQAPQVSGSPQARRRGRIYLGALTSAWISNGSTSSFPNFNGGARANVTTAASTFANACTAGGVRWSVWSPTDQASALVTNGWVDDSPDTQRRRSVDPSLRLTWTGGGA